MATKSRKTSSKKSSKKAAKKATKKTAQVELDPNTVHSFESYLREGLVASGAVMAAEAPELRPGAKVQLDSDTVAHLSEILREGLVASGAVLSTDYPEALRPAARSRTKTRRKARSSSKKR